MADEFVLVECAVDHLTSLPTEILFLLYELLPANDLLLTMMCCRTLHDKLCDADSFWRRILQQTVQDYPLPQPCPWVVARSASSFSGDSRHHCIHYVRLLRQGERRKESALTRRVGMPALDGIASCSSTALQQTCSMTQHMFMASAGAVAMVAELAQAGAEKAGMTADKPDSLVRWLKHKRNSVVGRVTTPFRVVHALARYGAE